MVPDNVCGYVTAPTAEAIAGGILKFYNDGPIDRFNNNIKAEKLNYSWDSFTKTIFKTAFGD